MLFRSPIAAIEPHDPPVVSVVAVVAEHTPLAKPLEFLGAITQQAATRTPIAVGLGVGLALCGIVVAALWNVGAAQGSGKVIADQAMNSASTPGTETASFRHPVPAPAPPDLLPTAPPEPKSTPVVPKGGSANRHTDDDPRVAEVRGAINRCKPLVPYSRSTITVKPDPRGKTSILFGEHEARGQLGRCVAKIAARTKIAKGERLSFKL